MLIGSDGEKIGLLGINDALEEAQKKNLDLVQVSPSDAQPVVCKLLDFGKFQFEKKKSTVGTKKPKKQSLKEIKFRPTTDTGDYNIKLRKLKEFLENGDKVKVTLRFRGREMVHQKLGVQLIERVKVDLDEYGTIEQHPEMEGRQMVMILGPKRK